MWKLHILDRKTFAPLFFTIGFHSKWVNAKNCCVGSFSKIFHPNMILICYSWHKLTSYLNRILINKFPLFWIGDKDLQEYLKLSSHWKSIASYYRNIALDVILTFALQIFHSDCRPAFSKTVISCQCDATEVFVPTKAAVTGKSISQEFNFQWVTSCSFAP